MTGDPKAWRYILSKAIRFLSQVQEHRPTPIRLAAPIPAIVVEWPTGVVYSNQAICPCCDPNEAEGFPVLLPSSENGPIWSDLCLATEGQARALIEEALEWANHRVRDLRFHIHPGNRYCWHRCTFDLEFWPTSLAFPPVDNGRFGGWLAWPWDHSTGYDPRPWGA
jgi:hypothetical protein